VCALAREVEAQRHRQQREVDAVAHRPLHVASAARPRRQRHAQLDGHLAGLRRGVGDAVRMIIVSQRELAAALRSDQHDARVEADQHRHVVATHGRHAVAALGDHVAHVALRLEAAAADRSAPELALVDVATASVEVHVAAEGRHVADHRARHHPGRVGQAREQRPDLGVLRELCERHPGADPQHPGCVVACHPAQRRHPRQADQHRRRVEEVLEVGQDVRAAGDHPRPGVRLQRRDHALDRLGALDLELRETQHQALLRAASGPGLCGANSPACSRRRRSASAASTRGGENGMRSRRIPTAS
jgi:hypothetical protein